MCGRFARSRQKKEEYAAALGLPVEATGAGDWQASYNVCPGTLVGAIRSENRDRRGQRTLAFAHLWWGLLPHWSKDARAARRPINAKAETAAEKPSFRKLLEWRRCLVPADGYYEWHTTPIGKIPYYFRRRDGAPILFAGLWDRWNSPQGGEAIESCTLFTTTPNRLAGRIHQRMPVIVRAQDYALWLDSAVCRAADIAHVLAPYPEDELLAWPVGRQVSDPASEGEGLIAPIGPQLAESAPAFGQLL